VLPSFGVHPWDAKGRSRNWLDTLQRRLDATPAAGIGEIGIDRWILDGVRPGDPRIPAGGAASLAEQEEVFLAQLALAAERRLPATIHCLQAWGRLLELLTQAPALPANGFLLHAYSGPADLVAAFARLGARFSFNGRFLAPERSAKLAPFRVVPADRLLVETDAPAMFPPPEFNAAPLPAAPDGTPVHHPASVALVIEPLAQLRNTTPESLTSLLHSNFTAWWRFG
jgi:TatD DNase family protein